MTSQRDQSTAGMLDRNLVKRGCVTFAQPFDGEARKAGSRKVNRTSNAHSTAAHQGITSVSYCPPSHRYGIQRPSGLDTRMTSTAARWDCSHREPSARWNMELSRPTQCILLLLWLPSGKKILLRCFLTSRCAGIVRESLLQLRGMKKARRAYKGSKG